MDHRGWRERGGEWRGMGGRGQRGGGPWNGMDRGRGMYRGRGTDWRRGGQGQDRGRGRGRNRFREERDYPMGNRRMVQLNMDSTDSEILLTLVDNSNGFNKELDEDHRDARYHDRMLNKLELIARCCSCESAAEYMIQLLKMVSASELVQKGYLNEFVADINSSIQSNSELPMHRYGRGLENILIIMKTFFIRMPHSDFVKKATVTLLVIENFINTNSEVVSEETPILYTEIRSLQAQLQDRLNLSKKPSASGQALVDDDARAPPCDFRDISVVPSLEDIHPNEETFLRANKMQGKYEDLNHYLDVQYRLLREDFVHPLRQGIQSHLEILHHQLPPGTKLTDVRIYKNVHILGAVCTGQGLAYRLRFDNSNTKKIKWENSKRLIFGSLIALSCDNFQTMYLCSVVNRQARDLHYGIVEVQVEQDADEFALIGPNTAFTMAETTAYFESYRHVLTALKDIEPADFPFQRYIVRCHQAIAVPRYLQRHGEVKFDFRPIIVDGTDSDNDANSVGREQLQDIPVQDLDKWPSARQLKLDDSQYAALQHCLTKEFALVQGPPGTGKTFLGLKVMQLLLHNWEKWNRDQDREVNKEPILVVCYTNHALDQFLEGIVNFTDKQVVRVGSRSQSELLKECSLNEIRNDMKKQRQIPPVLHNAFRNLQSELSELEEKIHTSTYVIESMEGHFIQLDRLQVVMSPQHIKQLEEYYYSRNDPLIEWLTENVYEFVQQQQPWGEPMEEVVQDEETADGEEDEVDEEERLRILEDDDKRPEYEKKKNESRKKMKQEIERAYFVQLGEEQAGPEVPQEDGWEIYRGKRNKACNRKKLVRIQKNVNPMTYEESEEIEGIYTLPLQDRHRLYKYWKELYKGMIRQDCHEKEKKYHELSQLLKEARYQLDKAVMKTGSVVGMTTTAAARYHRVLQEIRPRIIIVEEAAEVLEAHVVTALSRNCEHFILIGDHQQLRPSPNVFKLATKYHLDLSLFERMVNNRIPIRTLSLQHRMRPLISTLMKPFYADLEDDDSVHQYPEVKGVERSLYFITHNHPEEHQEEQSSKTNRFEAEYIEKLCKYLILQDYDPSQITILTPYSGQLFLLKNLIKGSFKGVRISVVDNFQGEENDIIILSLVRSNNNGKLGFLKIDNRVCVALSRAKMGFYVIGNVNFLADYSSVWTKIKGIAEEEGVIGGALSLVCQQHPETKIKASTATDFDAAPEGGCTLLCNARLECGHVCQRACHSYDLEHENIKCTKACTKYLCDQHQCPKKCSEPCGDCTVPVEKLMQPCNHKVWIPCHKDPTTWPCTELCEKILLCGHQCVNNCGDKCVRHCQVMVKRKLPCGHVCEMKCSEDPANFACTNQCQTELMCEHPCSGTCGSCRQGRLHEGCSSKCDRTLICSHACPAPCSEACPPCKKPCENRCPHSKCIKTCGEPCTPCKERCRWRCKHYKCTKLCSEPCDRPPCNQPCEKMLRCGHPCIGLCGEICPKVCRICDEQLVTDIFFGTEDESEARFIVLDCSHIVEVEGMDGWVASQSETETDTGIVPMVCPRCKTPVQKTLRYKKQIKTTFLDIERIKKKVLGDINRREKAFQLKELMNELQEEPADGLAFVSLLLECLEKSCHPPLNQEHFQADRETRFMKVVTKLSMSHSEIASLENLMNFAVSLEKIQKKRKKEEVGGLLKDCQDILQYFTTLRRTLHNWLVKMTRLFSRLSQQQCKEFRQEIYRVAMTLKLCRVKSRLVKHSGNALDESEDAKCRAASRLIEEVFKVLRSTKPYDENRNQKCEDVLKSIAEILPSGGLAISNEERIKIVEAIGLRQGHWYKCPNGHIYVITECGGAVHESNCPECGAKIGGANHQLRADNQLASEMDGATSPAYPTALMR